MDEKTIYQLRKHVTSSLNNLNKMWGNAIGRDRVALANAYEDLTKTLELIEKEIARIEDA